MNGMKRVLDYTQGLSVVARDRYESKVLQAGLDTDPYSMDDSKWFETPDVMQNTSWSDLMLYMTSTPSPYTKEEIKASYFGFAITVLIAFYCRLGKECLMEIVFFGRVGFML